MQRYYYYLPESTEVKQYYRHDMVTNIPIVYDRDSITGTTVLRRPYVLIDTESDSFATSAKAFFKKAEESHRPYFIALWNELDTEDLFLELDTELLDYIDSENSIFGYFFREVFYFQNVMRSKFSEDWIRNYKGEYINSDKSLIRGVL